MRKGLVITLGVVALALVVSPGFAVAPIISCIPDIIVSDFEQNQTQDNNLFIFSNALDLDEYVQDADTTDSSLLRWSFVQSSGPDISLNGILENTSGDFRNPGAFDIRAVSDMLTVRNEGWSPVAGTMPYADPGVASADSMIELYVSDGTNTDNQTVTITSENTGSPGTAGDRLVPAGQVSWTFATTSEGWNWVSVPAVYTEPAHTAGGGNLQMTEASGGTNIVYGGWETPQDPAILPDNTLGSIKRARFAMRSSVDGQTCPGFRIKAVTYPVVQSGGSWIPDFTSQDFNASEEAHFYTADPFYVAGREPGTAGKTYTILSYPEQTESLMSTTVVTYFGVELLDMDKTFSNDSGTLYVDQVDIDCLDRPAVGTGTAVPSLSFTDFSGWATTQNAIGGGGTPNPPAITATATGISCTLTNTNAWFDDTALSPAVALTPGAYYRVLFTVSITGISGTDFGPTCRTGLVSSRFNWSTVKNLSGGGLLANIGSTPQPFEAWAVGPPATAATTENCSVRFETWLTNNNTGFPFNRNVSGTIRATQVVVEQFPAPPDQ